LREYAAVQRERSQQASRADKHRLLDEMVAVTGMHPLDRQPGDCWVSHVRWCPQRTGRLAPEAALGSWPGARLAWFRPCAFRRALPAHVPRLPRFHSQV